MFSNYIYSYVSFLIIQLSLDMDKLSEFVRPFDRMRYSQPTWVGLVVLVWNLGVCSS